MHFFAKVFLIKKFQRIQVNFDRNFQNFLNDFRDSQSCDHDDHNDNIFNSSIPEYIKASDENSLDQNVNKITQMIEFIVRDKRYQEIYSQILCYRQHESISQPNLTRLLNQSSIFPYILQFLDFENLCNCSLVNSILFFHSYKPNIIHYLHFDETFMDKINDLCVNQRDRLAWRLGGINNILWDLTEKEKRGYEMINWKLEQKAKQPTKRWLTCMTMVDGKKIDKLKIKWDNGLSTYRLDRFLRYLEKKQIDKQLFCFEMETLGRCVDFRYQCRDRVDFESKEYQSLDSDFKLLNLENCRKISLGPIKKSIGVKISNKCQTLNIQGSWRMKQFSKCDFSGVETLSLREFKLSTQDEPDAQDEPEEWVRLKFDNIKQLIMNPLSKEAFNFYDNVNDSNIKNAWYLVICQHQRDMVQMMN